MCAEVSCKTAKETTFVAAEYTLAQTPADEVAVPEAYPAILGAHRLTLLAVLSLRHLKVEEDAATRHNRANWFHVQGSSSVLEAKQFLGALQKPSARAVMCSTWQALQANPLLHNQPNLLTV